MSTQQSSPSPTIQPKKIFDNVLKSGKRAGLKAKLKAEIMLLDRDITKIHKSFGILMYDTLSDLTTQQDFYATNDILITIVRPLLLTADRELRALDGRRLQAKGNLDIVSEKRETTFGKKSTNPPATNWKEKARNFRTSTGIVAEETKIKANIKLIDNKAKQIKEDFGIKMYAELTMFFSTNTISPVPVHSDTDNVTNIIRGMYQTCKSDVDEINRQKSSKEEEIRELSLDG